MIGESLVQSNFIGRDGFKWWIGQVAPEDSQGDQLNEIGDAWGNRVKVRIMGYHPQNVVELPDEDLPWAQVLLSPTDGSGKANRAKSLRLSPGDSVLGFFLDGDDAQLPVVTGVFGNTSYSPSEEYSGPFQPYTGYTKKIKNDGYLIAKTETNEQSGSSNQRSPRPVSVELAKKIEDATGKANRALNQAIGAEVVFGSTQTTAAIDKISSEVSNLVTRVQSANPSQLAAMVSSAAPKITGLTSGIVGTMVNSTYKKLGPALNGGLKKLYDSVYSMVFAATKSRSAAKRAGAAAQNAMVPGIGAIQKFLPCAIQNVAKNMLDTVKGLLQGIVDNVSNFVNCIGDQFIGGIFNHIVSGLMKGLGPLMGGVGKILGGFSLADTLRSTAEGLSGIANVIDCPTPVFDEAKENVRAWVIGKGPKNIVGVAVDKILEVANAAEAASNARVGLIQDLSIASGSLGMFDFLNPSVSNPGFSSPLGKCYAGPPLECAGLKINIFGGGGKGAIGKAILGAIVGEGAAATGSLIGIDMESGGSGYTSQPSVEIVDTCKQGYGAVAKAVVDYDEKSPTYQQIVDVYIISEGENYPIKDPQDTTPKIIDHVVVVSPGTDYVKGDIVTDSFDNEYTVYIDDNTGGILNVIPSDSSVANVNEITELPELIIKTQTGYGAILKPQLKPRPPYQGDVKEVIDCVS